MDNLCPLFPFYPIEQEAKSMPETTTSNLESEIAKLADKRTRPPTLIDDLTSIRDAIRALDNQVHAFSNRLLNTVGEPRR